MRHIFKCDKCGIYTMKKACPKCNDETINPKPPRFSIDDRYGNYRRKAKIEFLEKEGLI